MAWRASTWGDEISLEYGKALRGYESARGPVRVFGSNGPVGWTDKALATGPGVILGRKGAYRGVQYSEADFFVIDTAYYVVPKTDLDMRWLYYAIQYHKLGEIDDGSPIPSTTRAAVYVRELDVPPKDVQREMARILGSIDAKIDLNRRINQTLEAMAQAIFKSWFVDFDPVKAKIAAKSTLTPALSREEREQIVLRAAMSAISGKSDAELDALKNQKNVGWVSPEPSGGRNPTNGDEASSASESSGYGGRLTRPTQEAPSAYDQLAAIAALFPDEMEDSELGEIPRGWCCGTFGNLATLSKGSVNPLLSPESLFEHYSLPAFDAGRQPVIENGSAIKSSKTRFTKGAVLQSKLNPHIPRVWFPAEVGKNAVCSTEFLPWMAKTPATPEFVYCLLTCPNFETLIRGLVTGTSNSHQRVKPDQVANLPIVIPSRELFGAFAVLTARTFSFIGKSIEQTLSLTTLRDTLLPKLLSGELSVADALAEAGE